MAIFRQGKRIGPFDIRGGISRGDFKSSAYHKTDRDPRFKMQANTENTIGRFRAAINSAEGFARPSRFAVRIFPPSSLNELIRNQNNTVNADGQTLDSEMYNGSGQAAGLVGGGVMNQLTQTIGRQLNIMCDTVTMPGVDLQTQEIQYGSEPTRNQVTSHGFAGNIVATFYADKYLRERQFFEMWQKLAVNTISHKANYYDNYVANLNIFQLGQFASRQERDDITYGVQLIDCFPTKIGAIEYSHDANNIQTIDVDFSFRYWINYFIDKQGNIELGSPTGRIPEIKNNRGIFGSLINKLPPELRRAGRDVLNDLRRRVPLGRVTGGRVFPPFKIPPLNI